MNIKFMLSGGGMPPFTYYQPVMVNNARPERIDSGTESLKKTKSDELTQKDLFNMLKEIDGLPSDRQRIYNTLQTLFQGLVLGVSTSSLATTYLTALNLLKTAKFNKEEYDKAYKIADKNDALNEVAITESGYVMVIKNDDKSSTPIPIKPDELLKNRDKYTPITNSQLLLARAHDLPHANSIFNIVNNSISLPTIDKLLTLYLVDLGTSEYLEPGYIKTKGQLVMKGVEVLQKAALEARKLGKQFDASGLSIDGLYKAKLLTKDLADQAVAALSYLRLMLPDNAKTLLKLKTGSDKGIINLISNLITGLMNNTFNFDPELIEDVNGRKPGSASGSSGGDGTKLSSVLLMVLGYGYNEPLTLNIGNSYNITTNAVHNTLVSKEGAPFKASDSIKDVTSSLQSSNLDFDNATFGGSRLNDVALDYTAIKNNNMYVVELPIDTNSKNGVIKPNLELTSKLEQLDDEMLKLKIAKDDYDKINELCLQLNIPPKYIKYGNEWKLNPLAYKRFAIIYTTLDEKVLRDEDEFNPELVELVDDDTTKESFELLILKRTDDKSYSVGGWLEGSLFLGLIFIPIKDDIILATQAVSSTSQYSQPIKNVEDARIQLNMLLIENEAKRRYQPAPSLSTLL